MPESTSVAHRPGRIDDRDAVLALLDAAVEWLVARGQTDQWGTEPWSSRPAAVERIGDLIQEGDLWLAVGPAEAIVGAMIVNEAPMPYIEPAEERELYVRLLVSDPRHRGANIGGSLLDRAKDIAHQRGIALLRVDCFAGADGSLVRYYESQGFRPVSPFAVKEWPGMLLAQRIPPTGAPAAPAH
ncbi:MAG: GNAT family N-acetyltransferase [Thermomicrobiales bacterium]